MFVKYWYANMLNVDIFGLILHLIMHGKITYVFVLCGKFGILLNKQHLFQIIIPKM